MKTKILVSGILISVFALIIFLNQIENITLGYIDPQRYSDDPDLVNRITQVNYLETLVNYCFNHADRPNPLQDLRDKGFDVIGSDCKQVKMSYDEQLNLVNILTANYSQNHPCANIPPEERQYYPICKGK